MKLLKVKKISPEAILPKYIDNQATCFDVYTSTKAIIQPFEKKLIKTGLQFEIPEGYCLKLYLRSGISIKTPLLLCNGVGQIDSNYRGEVMIPLINLSMNNYIIEKGIRIAQMEFTMYSQCEIQEVDTINTTERGLGGFGSSGIK